jgi:hypothetical protein
MYVCMYVCMMGDIGLFSEVHVDVCVYACSLKVMVVV